MTEPTVTITVRVGDEVRYECPLGPAWGRVVALDDALDRLVVDTIFETSVDVDVDEITDWRQGPEWRRR